MRERPSSRLGWSSDPTERILLFRFEHKQGPLAGQQFWATPGGALDLGESYSQAASPNRTARRNRLVVDDPGPEVGQRIASFQMPDGEMVRADERFFLVRADALDISTERWTDLERTVMAAHRWWSAAELLSTAEQVWPEDLADLLVRIGVWKAAD